MSLSTSNEQLFTELTAEEASVLEGGATLILYNATAIKADADFGPSNGDDLYIKVNGRKIFGTADDVDTGETVNIGKRISFSGTAKVNLFDGDPWPNDDDSLGGFTVGSTPTYGTRTARVSGSGSTYDITYSIV
ncbi:hypothetical protein NIES4071_76610 [Calothrix sp. NIES-4071]|nr:hypothetical protein NIES4071_76610 [Calothrix sp. NIES-4071]BAZ61935.1 hypothetical protein NIES4105_76550 [Calothrix sp. NIES-4105]